MSLTDYFFKSEQITLFDTLVVAVLAVFIVSLLKQTAIITWKVILTICNFIKDIFTKYIPETIEKLRKKRNYNRALKNGEINLFLYSQLVKKYNEGTITRLERKALENAPEKHKIAYEAIAKIDLKKLIEENKAFPKI